MKEAPKLSVYTGAKAWDLIWKWTWFTKDLWQRDFRKSKEGTQRALKSLLPKLHVESILDCSCGLGWKTIILAEMGYEVEGSDGCAFAVKRASELASEEGLRLRFFRSRWADLGMKARRKYDCVYNDAFAWITTRRSLSASARGIYSVLQEGGRFLFLGAHQWSKPSDGERLIGEQWEKEGRFEVLVPYEAGGVKLITLIAREKTPEGILGNRIHIIEEHGAVRVQVASVLDLCKWTWQDYLAILTNVGFRTLYSVKERGVGPEPYIFNVAVK